MASGFIDQIKQSLGKAFRSAGIAIGNTPDAKGQEQNGSGRSLSERWDHALCYIVGKPNTPIDELRQDPAIAEALKEADANLHQLVQNAAKYRNTGQESATEYILDWATKAEYGVPSFMFGGRAEGKLLYGIYREGVEIETQLDSTKSFQRALEEASNERKGKSPSIHTVVHSPPLISFKP